MRFALVSAALMSGALIVGPACAFDLRQTRDAYLKACPEHLIGSLSDEQEALYCLCMWTSGVERNTKNWNRETAAKVLLGSIGLAIEGGEPLDAKPETASAFAHIKAVLPLCMQAAMTSKLDAHGRPVN